jgi:hypothetical protein
LKNDFSNPTPIATHEQYRAAILAVRQRMTATQLAMLQSHCRSAQHTISTNRLADLLELPSAASANIAYRNYAHWIADELKYVPSDSKSKNCWCLALAYGRHDGALDGEYEWIMRPELVETLQAMKWA